jgi:hypothetical protein
MVISATAPIDDSPSTLMLLETKIRNYILGATSNTFLNQYGRSAVSPISICISCAYPIAKRAQDLIESLRATALKSGIGLEVRRHMGDVH